PSICPRQSAEGEHNMVGDDERERILEDAAWTVERLADIKVRDVPLDVTAELEQLRAADDRERQREARAERRQQRQQERELRIQHEQQQAERSADWDVWLQSKLDAERQ